MVVSISMVAICDLKEFRLELEVTNCDLQFSSNFDINDKLDVIICDIKFLRSQFVTLKNYFL